MKYYYPNKPIIIYFVLIENDNYNKKSEITKKIKNSLKKKKKR